MQQNFPNSLWKSWSNIFRDPEVRYCALVFQDVDNCSSVLVFQVTRMGTKSHLQGEGCRDSNPFFPKHPHTVSPPSTHTGARAHLYSHVQIWTLQAHNCPWQALWGQLGKEREQATRGKDLSLLPFPPLPLLEFWSEAPDYKCVIATCAIFSSSSLPESRDWGSFPSKARQETDNERRLWDCWRVHFTDSHAEADSVSVMYPVDFPWL